MKALKALAAGLLALSLVGTASAQSTLLIAGATTYRGGVHLAIQNSLKPGYTYAYSGAAGTFYKSSAAVFSGTLASTSAAVIIKTYWTGSLAGVSDVVQQRTFSGWIDQTQVTLSSTGTPLASYTAASAAPNNAWSDAQQGSVGASLLKGNAAAKTAGKAVNNAALQEAGSQGQTVQGIIAFEWVTQRTGTNALPFSNITEDQANSLVSDGNVPVVMLTGNTSNTTDYLFLTGRGEDSGSRINAFADAQTGFGNPPIQWMMTWTSTNGLTSYTDPTLGTIYTGGTNGVLSSIAQWPANAPMFTNTNLNWNTLGHSGYNGGGDVSNVLQGLDPVNGITVNGGPSPVGKVYIAGYLGSADANGAVGAGATALTYNGVAYSQNAVRYGQYGFWGFEHCYYLTSGNGTLTGAALQAANDVADAVYLTDAPTNSGGAIATDNSAGGILFNSAVLVTRGQEGGTITQTY